MKIFFQSLGVLSGCVFFASVVKGVEGLAATQTHYADETCQTPVLASKSFTAYTGSAVGDISGEFTLVE